MLLFGASSWKEGGGYVTQVMQGLPPNDVVQRGLGTSFFEILP